MKRLYLIEDPQDPDALDPFKRPVHVDPVAEAKAAEPPFGEGLHEVICTECGLPFRTDDIREVLCPPCNSEESALEQAQGAQHHVYSEYRKFGRRS